MRRVIIFFVCLFSLCAYSADEKKIGDFLPAVEADNLTPGLIYSFFKIDKKVNTVDKLGTLTAIRKGIIHDVSLKDIRDDEFFGLIISGFIKIQNEGIYTFELNSDDGSKLYINNKMLIDNDGMHAPESKSINVGLSKGLHPIKILFIQGGGGKTLNLKYSGPGIPKQSIPVSALFNNEDFFEANIAEYRNKSVIRVNGSKKYIGKKVTVTKNDAILSVSSLIDAKENSFLEIILPADIKFDQNDFKVNVEEYGYVPVSLVLRLLNKATGAESEPFAGDLPKILAIANFGNLTDIRHTEIASLGTRDQLVAELVSSYFCYTVGRSNGYNLAMEEALGNMKGIDNDKQNPAGIPAVDYAISGYFQRVGRGHEIECILQILNPKIDELPERIAVKVPSVYQAPKILAEFLAKKFNLKNSKLSLRKEGEKSNKTWAVLPFARLDKKMDFGKVTDEELSLQAELILQNQPGIKNLVDRKKINAVFDEMKIVTMQASTERMAGSIAKIVGADRILMGTVTPSLHGLVRLDIILVDGSTALVLNTRSAICNEAYLAEAVSILIKDIALFSYSAPSLKIASLEERHREGKFYLSSADTKGRDWRNMRSTFGMTRAMLLEAAYYLLKDDSGYHCRIATILTNIHNTMKPPGKYDNNLLILAEKIYSQTSITNEDQRPLLGRSYCHYRLGNFQLAINFAQEHLDKYPEIVPYSAHDMFTRCYYKMGKYDKAAEYLSKCRSNSFKPYWIRQIYKNIDDEAAELREFRSVKIYNNLRFNYKPELIRLIELVRKLEGAEKALEELKKTKMLTWSFRPDVRFEYAYCLALTGEKELATRIFSSLLNTPNNVFNAGAARLFIILKSPEEFKKQIKLIMEKLGLNKRMEKWKLPYEVRKLPKQCKFLLVPLGDVAPQKIEEMKNRFKEVFGADLLVSNESIPITALPKNTFNLHSRMYDSRKIRNWVRENVRFNDDVFQVIMLTREPCTVSNYFSAGLNGINMFSYYRKEGHVYNYLSRFFEKVFSYPADCFIYPCGGFVPVWGSAGKKICEDCQKRFKDFDFDNRMQRIKSYRKMMLKDPKIIIE